MLEKLKSVIDKAILLGEIRVKLFGRGLNDKDIHLLKELLEKTPSIIEIDLTNNNLTSKSGKILAEIKSLERIFIAQNSLEDSGATPLLSMESLKFLDLSDNNISFAIEPLLTKRRAENVEVITAGNPRLDPDYLSVDSKLLQSSVRFQVKKPVVPEEKKLSDAESVAKFGLQPYSNEASGSGSSPEEPANLELERHLRQQIDAYRATHPNRCDEFLREEMNHDSSFSNKVK
jgi:hypothetical protein